jgi:hypothetical protein
MKHTKEAPDSKDGRAALIVGLVRPLIFAEKPIAVPESLIVGAETPLQPTSGTNVGASKPMRAFMSSIIESVSSTNAFRNDLVVRESSIVRTMKSPGRLESL